MQRKISTRVLRSLTIHFGIVSFTARLRVSFQTVLFRGASEASGVDFKPTLEVWDQNLEVYHEIWHKIWTKIWPAIDVVKWTKMRNFGPISTQNSSFTFIWQYEAIFFTKQSLFENRKSRRRNTILKHIWLVRNLISYKDETEPLPKILWSQVFKTDFMGAKTFASMSRVFHVSKIH